MPGWTKTLKNKNNLTEIKMYKPLFYLSFPGQYFSLSFIEFDIVKKITTKIKMYNLFSIN